MALLLYSTPGPAEPWLAALRRALPEVEIRTPDAAGDPREVAFLVAARIEPGALARYPALRLVVSLLAGVERLLADHDLPDVPIARAGPPDGDAMVTEFAILHVLRHHRDMPALALAQREAEWLDLRPIPARERRVGFLGLGNIGQPAAERVRDLGFDVAGWSRTPKSIGGIESFHGPDGLAPFLERTEIVVNLLALTPETEDLLCARTFALLPKGASLVNLGRGQHVLDADLIAALDSGHLAAATLDVFREEPLPPDHPFWRHPKVTVTPHASRTIFPEALVPQVADNVRRVLAGEPTVGLVDRARGY